jgi:steroid delta-isomerase-like uncharacterized protein
MAQSLIQVGAHTITATDGRKSFPWVLVRVGTSGAVPYSVGRRMGDHMTSETASPAANVELVRAGFRAFNAGDTDECMARMAPDFVINLAEMPEPQHGREVWRQGFEMMKHAFPDLQAHIEDIFAAQDKVAVRLRFRGTNSGEFMGFHPTGRTIEYVSHEFYRLADGLVAEEWICSDMATLLRQIS